MQKRTKVTVRRRIPEDDTGLPEDFWPPELVWVCDSDTWYEDGSYASGGTSPYVTWREAMDQANERVAETRQWNEREEQETKAGAYYAYESDCPAWKCPHVSVHDWREGLRCPEHPCICPPEPATPGQQNGGE
jgi:hypothetical protein